MAGRILALLFSKKFRAVCIKAMSKFVGVATFELYEFIFHSATAKALHTFFSKVGKNKTGTGNIFKSQPFVLYKLDSGPSTDFSVTKEDALRFYKDMAMIRKFEQSAGTLYTSKAIRGFLHLYSGQFVFYLVIYKSCLPETMWKIPSKTLFSKRIRTLTFVEAIHNFVTNLRRYSDGSCRCKSESEPYILYKLDSGPSRDLSVNKDDALRFYKDMAMIRKFEQSAATLYTAKAIRGFLHLYSGQLTSVEAIQNFVTNLRRYSDASFKSEPYVLHNLDSGPATNFSVTKEDALRFYKDMTMIRKFEQSAATLYTAKTIRGFLHLYSGQEAICVGMHAALKPVDHVITSYRCHGWCRMMGMSTSSILAELTGRETGNVRGKGGSMHLFCKNFYGGNGIVGAHVPIGVGLAFACKYKNDGGVGIALYGDGAANQGQIFEVYNMAKLWSLPMIFVCENNLYAMGTPVARGSANQDYHNRGVVIPGIKCDGMDILAMREVAKFARDFVLKNGPILIEAVTYRYFGHSMSDPGISYRKREEIDQVRKNRDPITTFKERVLSAKIVEEDQLKKIDEEVKKEVDDAVQRAKTDPEINIKELTYDIYSKNLAGSVRNTLPWNPMEHKNIRKAINLE